MNVGRSFRIILNAIAFQLHSNLKSWVLHGLNLFWTAGSEARFKLSWNACSQAPSQSANECSHSCWHPARFIFHTGGRISHSEPPSVRSDPRCIRGGQISAFPNSSISWFPSKWGGGRISYSEPPSLRFRTSFLSICRRKFQTFSGNFRIIAIFGINVMHFFQK